MVEEALEPEVVDQVEEFKQEFDKELKQKVLERDLHRCQICGKDQNLQVAHIQSGYEDGRELPSEEKKKDQGHRGMGGRESVNRPENLITLCEKHHSMLDKKHGKSISIERWVPDDNDNGLVVLDNHMRKIDKEELYFYALPPQDTIEEAHDAHDKLMSSLDKMLDNFHSSLELLYWMKEKELYKAIPAPELQVDFYNSFKDYYLHEVKSKFGYKLTVNSIYTYHSAIKPLIDRVDDPEERHKVRRGNLPALGTILNDEDLDEQTKQEAIEMAKGRQDEFKKYKRDLAVETKDGVERVKSCFNCAKPEDFSQKCDQFEACGNTVKLGGSYLPYCPYSDFLLDSISKVKAESVAEDCDEYMAQD